MNSEALPKPHLDTSGSGAARQAAARALREEAAVSQSHMPMPDLVSNGDETALPRYIASFGKGLPHSSLG